jgi:hypothetical protein
MLARCLPSFAGSVTARDRVGGSSGAGISGTRKPFGNLADSGLPCPNGPFVKISEQSARPSSVASLAFEYREIDDGRRVLLLHHLGIR